MSEIMDKYARMEAEATAKAKAAILAKADALVAAGVLCIVAEFNGYGDEGSIERLKYFDAMPDDGPDAEPTIDEKTLAPALLPDENDFYTLCPGGFDQNEGSAGTITVDLTAKTVNVRIGWNYTETRYSDIEV